MEARNSRLRAWMTERDITNRAVAEKLGVALSSAHRILNSEDMPTKYHAELVRLGFPAELLPAPLDRKTGRPAKVPRFPVDQEAAQ